MSLFKIASAPIQTHYQFFKKEYRGTVLLLAVAVVGAMLLAGCIFWQSNYLLSAAVLPFGVIVGLYVLGSSTSKRFNWKKFNSGWRLLALGVFCLMLRQCLSLIFLSGTPFTALLFLVLSIIAQVCLIIGLVLSAWISEEHALMRAFIDSLIIVLAFTVLAWAEGVRPLVFHSLSDASQYKVFFISLLWINTFSGVLLLISVFFFFICSYITPGPGRSAFWVSAGTIVFLLIHTLQTYTIGDLQWDHLSAPWLTISGSLALFCVVLFFIGMLWQQVTALGKNAEVIPSLATSQQRLITLWFPYGAALAVGLLLLLNEILPNAPRGHNTLPLLLLLIAILSRQMLTMWDNLRLSEQLTKSNTNLESNVMERTKHLATLHSITSTLNSSLDRNSVLQIALEQIMGVTNAEQGAIWLRTEKGQDVKNVDWNLAYAQGFPSQDHETALRDLAIKTVDGNFLSNNHVQKEFEKVYGFPSSSGKLLVVPIRSGGLLLGAQALILKSGKLNYETRSVVESVALEVGISLQNARLYQDARRRADRDGVTGLYNHRAIQERLAGLLQYSRKSGEQFAVLMMDLNDFKYFNDTYGHPVGDNVLRAVAEQLEKISGPNNPVGRYGGDEFIVLLPGQDHRQAVETYQKILAVMKQEHFEATPGVRIPISMSYGWSVFPENGQSALDLITIADANLYRYKQRGDVEDSVSINRRRSSDGGSTAFGVLDALITAIDNKDHYTRQHSDEVAHYALLIAEELGYSSESLRAVRISGLLHDVGKIAVPDDILRHPGKLSLSDWEIMKQHPTFGALIVKDLPYVEDVVSGIRSHHERWDGRGYPDGLAGTQIPIMGRLLAVPDTYSALTTNRPYRKGQSPTEALMEIRRSIHTQFDPLIAKTFLDIMERQLQLEVETSSASHKSVRDS